MNWDNMNDHAFHMRCADVSEAAQEIIAFAMEVVEGYDALERLEMLKDVLRDASFFVDEELEQQEERVAELGLDKWIEEERVAKEEAEQEEAERQEWIAEMAALEQRREGQP